MKRPIDLTDFVINFELLLGLSLWFPQLRSYYYSFNFTLKNTSALHMCNTHKDLLSSLVLHYSLLFVETLELRGSETSSSRKKRTNSCLKTLNNMRGCVLKISGAV